MAKKNPYLNDRDILDQALEHSWGKTADAKAKEKAYNREYYQRHKEEILRKARQAGEGIQRTAQNAYNTARREARGIRDAVNPQPRQYSNPKGWTGGRDNTLWGMDKYVDGAYKERINEARKNRNLAKNTPGAAETERRYRNAMRERSQNAAAVNEALKDGRQLAPDSRFDSKLVRDAQNAYSKARGAARKAKDAVDRYVDEKLDYAKKLDKDARLSREIKKHGSKERLVDTAGKIGRKIVDHYSDEDLRKAGISEDKIKEFREAGRTYSQLRGHTSSALNEMEKARKQASPTERLKRDARRIAKDARTGIDDAYNRAKSGIEDVYNQASRKAKNVKNDLETSKRLRQMKNADALLKAVNRLPSDKYEETRELARKLRSANAQAYNQASKTKKKKKS